MVASGRYASALIGAANLPVTGVPTSALTSPRFNPRIAATASFVPVRRPRPRSSDVAMGRADVPVSQISDIISEIPVCATTPNI